LQAVPSFVASGKLSLNVIRFLFLHERSLDIFPSFKSDINALFQNPGQYFGNPLEKQAVLSKEIEESNTDTYTSGTNSAKVESGNSLFANLEKIDTPEWILSDMACACPELNANLEPEIADHELVHLHSQIHVEFTQNDNDRYKVHSTICRLYSTFLKILGSETGIAWTLLRTGSYHNDVKVGQFDEIDFIGEATNADFKMNQSASLDFKVSIPQEGQCNNVMLMRDFIHRYLKHYLKSECTPIHEKEAEEKDKYKVKVKSCLPNRFSPAVCTVFEWRCIRDHVHELSVDLTPALPHQRVKDLLPRIEVLGDTPFKEIKDEILDTIIHLVPTKDQHFIFKDGFVISYWKVSLIKANSFIYEHLDNFSPNVKKVYRLLKIFRDVLFPYFVKASSNDQSVDGQLLSSYALFNILLEEVLENPHEDCWIYPRLRERLVSVFHRIAKGQFTEFLTRLEMRTFKLLSLTDSQRTLMQGMLKKDIKDIIHVLTHTGTLNDKIELDTGKVSLILFPKVTELEFFKTSKTHLMSHTGLLRQQINMKESADIYYYKFVPLPTCNLTRKMHMFLMRKFDTMFSIDCTENCSSQVLQCKPVNALIAYIFVIVSDNCRML